MSSGDKVLIVDDDYDIREALKDVLTDRGFEVAVANDGFAALEYLRTHSHPFVILLDWMMPRCDGATFRAEQRNDPALAGIPVVLLTAAVNLKQEMSAINAVGYLQKPVDLQALMDLLELHRPPSAVASH